MLNYILNKSPINFCLIFLNNHEKVKKKVFQTCQIINKMIMFPNCLMSSLFTSSSLFTYLKLNKVKTMVSKELFPPLPESF